MIIAQGISKFYGSDTNTVVALAGIHLEIEIGTRVALVARSGSGKTTLLNLIAGLDRPSVGELRVAGQDLHRAKDRQTIRCHNLCLCTL